MEATDIFKDESSSKTGQSSSELNETSSQSIQSTKVDVKMNPIEKKTENLHKATRDLWEKRKYFDEQMTASMIRREQLADDKKSFAQRKSKCDTIIRENQAKGFRALEKFFEDNATCAKKRVEKKALNAQLKKARQNYSMLTAKAASLRKYERYMLDVIASLPKDYIKLADDVIVGLMMRYNTLYETNNKLRNEMETKSEEVRIAQADLKQLFEDHRISLFQGNSQLSELYDHREKMSDVYQGAKQTLLHSYDEMSQQLARFKTTLRAINNVAGKLIRAFEPRIPVQQLQSRVHNMSLLARCRYIQDRTLTIRSIVNQLSTDTGYLPVSKVCRPELNSGNANPGATASMSEFTHLSKLTSAQSDLS